MSWLRDELKATPREAWFVLVGAIVGMGAMVYSLYTLADLLKRLVKP